MAENERRQRPMAWWLALASLPLALMYTAYAIEHQPSPEEKPATLLLPEVAVLQIKAEKHAARVQAYGEVTPRYALQLQAEIDGRIQSIAPAFEAGRRLGKGAQLLSIDATSYRQSLASAEQMLAEAQLQWAQEQQEAARAKEDWLQSGLGALEDAPALLLRGPQLKAAEAKVKQAQAQLTLAQRDLRNSKVHSPFDAVVVERLVVPGQYVRTGDALAQIHSVDRADVRITMPPAHWALLPDAATLRADSQVRLRDDRGHEWRAKITELDQHIDQRNRQRSLLLSVENPLQQQPALLAGTFVSVEISGRDQAALLRVPAASLSGDGRLWYVAANAQLASFGADIIFQHDGWLYVRPPQTLLAEAQSLGLQIVTTPLSSYVDGQQVAARQLGVNAG